MRPAATPQPMTGAARFAVSVAIADDQVLVGRLGGSPRVDAPINGVHVFQRDSTDRWVERMVLAPKTVSTADEFGATLVADGRWLAIGAPGAQRGRGAIYLYWRDNVGRWKEHVRLIAAAGATNDSLGRILALRGDLLLAGAPAHADHRGSVAVFRRNAKSQTWTEQASLSAPDSSMRRFGEAVALASGQILIGAPGSSALAAQQLGQVVLFRDSSQSWVEDGRIAVAGADARRFGRAMVATDTTVWIAQSGSQAWISEFRRDRRGRWVEAAHIQLPKPSQAATILAHDGRDLFIGAADAWNERDSVDVFRPDSLQGSWSRVQSLSPPTMAGLFAEYGKAIAASDGIVAIAAPRQFTDDDGVVVLYRREAKTGNWREIATLADPAAKPWKAQPLTGGVIPCQSGRVHRLFDCDRVDLLAYLPLAALGGKGPKKVRPLAVAVTDLWGWTDPLSGREFVILGREDATAFVEVTDPTHPRYLGELPIQGETRAGQHSIKTYQHYAFVVVDGARIPQGIQIFDLRQLLRVRDANMPVSFRETAHYDEVGNVHNIIIDTIAGYAYTTQGSKGCGGLQIVDIREPTRPVFAGCSPKGAHDGQCVTYHGPDQSYRGRQICVHANVSEVDIVDVTDKQQPKLISVATYPTISIAHQGWFTDDQRYFVLDDEGNNRTIVFDFSELSDPIVAAEFVGMTAATDHNLFVRGPYVYQGNYKAGLRVLDIRDPGRPREVAYFDTTPHGENNGEYAGAWGTYPFLRNNVVAVSSMNEGLFLLRFQPPAKPE